MAHWRLVTPTLDDVFLTLTGAHVPGAEDDDVRALQEVAR